MRTTPDDKDRQINPNPTVSRISEGEFTVRSLLLNPWSGPNWYHTLYAECEYRHRELKITLSAPNNVREFVKDEARRVAIIEHLRTEHQPKPKTRANPREKPN